MPFFHAPSRHAKKRQHAPEHAHVRAPTLTRSSDVGQVQSHTKCTQQSPPHAATCTKRARDSTQPCTPVWTTGFVDVVHGSTHVFRHEWQRGQKLGAVVADQPTVPANEREGRKRVLRCLPVLDIGFLPLLGCEQPGGTNCKPLGITGGALAPLHESGGQGKEGGGGCASVPLAAT